MADIVDTRGNSLQPLAELELELGNIRRRPVGPGLQRVGNLVRLSPAVGQAPLPGTPGALPAPIASGRNAGYVQQRFSLGAYQLQTLLLENPQRATMQIQVLGSGAVYVLMQPISIAIADYSGSAGEIAQITALASTGIALVGNGGTPAGGSYEPYQAPRNAVTLICLATASNGIIIEGS